jgi:hypothetical protein
MFGLERKLNVLKKVVVYLKSIDGVTLMDCLNLSQSRIYSEHKKQSNC